MRFELIDDEHGHLRIKRRKHLGRSLHERDVKTLLDQVLSDLETDEPCADHDCRRRRRSRLLGQAGGIFDRSQRCCSFVARDWRPHGCGTHAQHECVVINRGDLTGSGVSNGDRLRWGINRGDLTMHVDVEPESLEELTWSLKNQVLFLFDQATDEVGQAAVGE